MSKQLPVGPSVLGDKILALRREAGLTQAELAALAGVSLSTLYRAEQSDSAIGPRMVSRLAMALSVEPKEIYLGEASPVPNRPVSAVRAEMQHVEVIERLDQIQKSVDRLH